MWIQTSNNALRTLKLPWMDDRLEWTANQTANVDSETGERLIDERDDITAVSDTDEVPDEDLADEELGDHSLDDQPDVTIDSDDEDGDEADDE